MDLDFTSDSGEMFSLDFLNTDDGSFSNLRGTALYNAAKKRCSAVLNQCKDAGATTSQITGNYDLAIDKDCINMTYYEALCDCIIQLKQHKKEIEKYLSDTTNPYNKIVVGLLYFKTGQKITAKLIFDDFVNEYPDMLITSDVKAMLNKM